MPRKKAELTEPKIKAKTGRPTKYDPSMCDKIIDAMSRGYTIAKFCVDVGIHKDTLYEWVKVHPEFSDSLKLGEAHRSVFWEDLLISSCYTDATGNKTINPAPVIFALKTQAKDYRFREVDEDQQSDLSSLIKSGISVTISKD